MVATSRSVVLVALAANAAIAALKFGGYLLTGSPAMLSETYHSLSDTGNQVLLLVGIRYGERDATRAHPFGYGKAQFFYGFLVSVLLFGIAGWESAKHGYAALVSHESTLLIGTVSVAGVSFPAVYVNYAILLGGVFFEGYSFRKAYHAMDDEIEAHGWSGFVEAFRKTSNIPTLTALTEDTVAVGGLALAFAGIFLTRVTGNPVFDAGSALLIGLLLMTFALALAVENRRLLIGESLPAEEERTLRELVANWDDVTELVDFRTVYFGPERVVVAADVAFDPGLDTEAIDEHISAIEAAMVERNGAIRKVYIEPETEGQDDAREVRPG